MNRFIKWIGSLKKLIVSSSRRFPVSLGISFVAVVLGIIINHTDLRMDGSAGRIVLILLMGIPLSAVVKLVCEKHDITGMIHLFILIPLAGLGALYYLLMPEHLDAAFRLRYGVLMALFIIGFTLVPYIGTKRHYAIYVLKLVQGFFITYLYTAVIAGGLSAILGATDFLLGVRVNSEFYGDVWMIAAGIFGLLLFFGKVPAIDAEFSVESYPVFFRVLFVNIVMPLLALFTVVFYIYLVQTIMGVGVLKNLVSRIILSYGFVSAFLFMAVMPLAGRNKWVKRYVRIYPFVFIMPLVMLFISLFQRIGQYSWTSNRYLVFMAGVWLVVVLVYGIISTIKDKPAFEQRLAVVICILLLVSIAGPQNAIAVSNRGQAARLEKVLAENNMLDNGRVVPNENLDNAVMDNIRSMVGYLTEFRGLSKAKYLPSEFVIDDMQKTFGFDQGYYYYSGIESVPKEYVDYFYSDGYFLDISNYDAALEFESGMNDGMKKELAEYDAVVTIWPDAIVVEVAGVEYPRIEFKDIVDGFDRTKAGRESQEMIFTGNYGFGRMTVALRNANGRVENDKIYVDFASGSAYFDFKQQ